jgi:hypothetical protein
MIEIYNETVQDLFILPEMRPRGGLEIRENKLIGVYVDGCVRKPVTSYTALEKVIDEAFEHRTLGSTMMNATSSRAHTVTTIEFKQVEAIGPSKQSIKLSMINLVDLAGSEKSKKAETTGERLKEGSAINKSLTCLGNVIEKLAIKCTSKTSDSPEKKKSSKKQKDWVIPYRDSKLTRLLQNALGGSSKTIMICAISPAQSNSDETLSTLRYADRAKKIKNIATVNENPQDKLVREMKEENDKLKQMMEAMTLGGSVDVVALQEKQLEIKRAEEALQEMQRSWEDKLKEAQERSDREKEMRGRRATMSYNALQSRPHIVNLSA